MGFGLGRLGIAMLCVASVAVVVPACGGGGTSSQSVGPAAGGSNNNTPAAGLTLKNLSWGRLVDIRAIDGAGNSTPITKVVNGVTVTDQFYLDQLVSENVGISKTLTSTTGTPVQLTLQGDVVTGAVILTIGTQFDAAPKSLFQRAFDEVTGSLGSIATAGPSSVPPFTEVPRDASFRLIFDRAINPKSVGPDTVRLFVGSATSSGQLPPDPFQGRFIFKPESPRELIIDPTVSALDDSRIDEAIAAGNKMNPQALPLNSQGLPPSISTATYNIGVFLPSRYDLAKGVTRIILGKDGSALNPNASITKFSSTTTGDGVVRVFRAGGAPSDANQGFLSDPTPPRILGSQPMTVNEIVSVDQRTIKITYVNTACDISIRVGDSIQQGGSGATRFATVVAIDPASIGDADPSYTVTVNYLQASTFNTTDQALLTTLYDEATMSNFAGCFVVVQPLPLPITIPLTNIDPSSTFTVRFTKPVNLSKINSIENFCVVMNPTTLTEITPTSAQPFDMAIGSVVSSPDQRSLKFIPVLPFRNDAGAPQTADYIFYVVGGSTGVTDLVGNSLPISQFGFKMKFKVNPAAATNSTRGLSLRFDSLFEATPPAQLVGGQVTQPAPGFIGPRPPTHFSRNADGSNVFVGSMQAFNQAVQTPLSNLGSRLMTVYRHIDLNLAINSISDTDLDVERMAWTPFGGIVQNDFFGRFRIDLSHSRQFPDEFVDPMSLLPVFPASGLQETSFIANVFEAADHPPDRVYDGQYVINPNAAFLSPSGVTMVPYPQFTSTFTWRDSSYGAGKFAGQNGFGVNPQQYYALLPFITPPANANTLTVDHPYKPNQVPSVGLPLLFDCRVYPAQDSNTKGLNGFQVNVALNSSSKPNFRVFSTGGLDQGGTPQTVTPDVAPGGLVPNGGYFPPGSTQGPAGTKTPPGGPEVYPAQIDFAVKVSRVYTHFYNLTSVGINNPIFDPSWIVMLPAVQPTNTSATVQFRGADSAGAGFTGDARCFDAYGEFYTGAEGGIFPTIPQLPTGVICGANPAGVVPNTKGTGASGGVNFTDNITLLNAKRFLQMRFTFSSDIVNDVAPSLTAVGVGFSAP